MFGSCDDLPVSAPGGASLVLTCTAVKAMVLEQTLREQEKASHKDYNSP